MSDYALLNKSEEITGGGVCQGAAAGGHLEVLEWRRDPDTGEGVCPLNEDTISET